MNKRYWTVVKKDTNGKIIQRVASFESQSCASVVCDFKNTELVESENERFDIVYSDVWGSSADYLNLEEYPRLSESINSKLTESEKYFLKATGVFVDGASSKQ